MYGVATHVREEKNIGDRIVCIKHEKKIETKKHLKRRKKSEKNLNIIAQLLGFIFFTLPLIESACSYNNIHET